MARRRGGRMPAALRRYWATHRRGGRKRARARRNDPGPRHHRRSSYARNAPRRRVHRGGGRGGGLPDVRGLMPVVATGVVAGVSMGWAMPYVAAWFNLVPAGIMYRLAQGAVALGGGWLGRQFKVVSPHTANIFAGYGLTFAALGLWSDFQMGILTPPMSAAAGVAMPGATPPATLGYDYGVEPWGGSPYGAAYMGAPYGAGGGMGYYEAVG